MADGSDQDEAEAEIEEARKLFVGACDFTAGAVSEDQLPPGSLSEIAFAGRSNVGKSSLINALTGRKALARTSSTPGRTQQINFFDLGGRLSLVDLPGYGYARTSKERVAAWTRLIMRYLKGRVNLRRVVLLIDSRRGIGDGDREVMKTLDAVAVNYQIVLTKGDKGRKAVIEALVARIATEIASHPAAHPEILVTSARDDIGIAPLRTMLAALAAPKQLS